MESANLSLPYLMPSQAQKHVTHNEALVLLDAIVQLAVSDRDRKTPPIDPQEGQRHIVALDAEGEWVGHDGEIACYLDGGWRYLQPKEGWLAWSEGDEKLYVRRLDDWRSFAETLATLGINATPDTYNRVVVASAASLFTHDGGDHQLTINKAGQSARASLMFQSDWVAHAEIGLVGSDSLLFKVSGDGSSFIEALQIDPVSGDTCLRSLNGGPLARFRNAIINPSGLVNQRGFAGGALAAGAYGYDRWKAIGVGCELSVASGRFTLNGTIGQTIEAAGLAGSTVTVSVESPDGELGIGLGTHSWTIGAGTGRRHVTFHLGSGEASDLLLEISAASPVTFGDVQVERGPWPTPFERRPAAVEDLLCRRYFEVVHPIFSGATSNGATFRLAAPYSVAKRTVPVVTVEAVELATNAPATPASYTPTSHGTTTGAHLQFVATATSAAAAVQLQINSDAEF